MNDLLTPVKSKVLLKTERKSESVPSNGSSDERRVVQISSWDHTLQLLQSRPGIEDLARCLRWLKLNHVTETRFDLRVPSPRAAQIIFALIHQTLPEYWPVLEQPNDADYAKAKSNLTKCLSNVPGVSAVASRLQVLLKELPNLGKTERPSHLEQVSNLIRVLEAIMEKDRFLFNTLHELNKSIVDPQKRTFLWKEFVSLLAGGKILSLCSEGDEVINEAAVTTKERSWLAQGAVYVGWLGRNCACMVHALTEDINEPVHRVTQVFSKALKIGYTGTFDDRNLSIHTESYLTQIISLITHYQAC